MNLGLFYPRSDPGGEFLSMTFTSVEGARGAKSGGATFFGCFQEGSHPKMRGIYHVLPWFHHQILLDHHS